MFEIIIKIDLFRTPDDVISVNWLRFLSRLVDNKKTLDVFVSYFNQNPELILQIFKSITQQSFQKDEYCHVYIYFFTNVFLIGKINCTFTVINLL